MISDRKIKELLDQNRLKIDPFDPACLQPVSYDVHLGPWILEASDDDTTLDLGDPLQLVRMWNPRVRLPERQDANSFSIGPGEFMLGEMEEFFSFSKFVAGRLDGKSTIGRIGLFVHVTAGVFDPGWSGKATFELFNASRRHIRLWRGMKIGQMTFEFLPFGVDRPYGQLELDSHYMHDMHVQGSRGLCPVETNEF